MANVLPLHNKDLLPEHRRDRSLFIFMHVAVVFYLLWELGVVVPRYHSYPDLVVFGHALFGTFVVVNILGNVYKLKRVDASGKHRALPAVLLEGWTYCYICQLNAPPRAHHCTLCKECILKRDHHCAFTGCCIGYYNQRYYVVAIAYIFLGAVYCACYQWDYCSEFVDARGVWALLCLVAPHLAVVGGSLSAQGFLVVSLHSFVLVAALMASYLLAVQAVTISCGQTPYERRQGIASYSRGWRANFLDVFGKRWYAAWLWPWLPSPLLGDGIRFLTRHEDAKDI